MKRIILAGVAVAVLAIAGAAFAFGPGMGRGFCGAAGDPCVMAGGEMAGSADAFTNAPGTAKDWRYYFARYEAMRGQQLECAGNYVLAPDPGYAMCIPLSDSCDNRSNHHDAYLLALASAAGLEPDCIGNSGSWPRCFPGDETKERHLTLRRSGLKIRCVENGWSLSDIPDEAALRSAFDAVATRHGVHGGLLAVPQTQGVDTPDRIALGAALLRELVGAGL